MDQSKLNLHFQLFELGYFYNSVYLTKRGLMKTIRKIGLIFPEITYIYAYIYSATRKTFKVVVCIDHQTKGLSPLDPDHNYNKITPILRTT